MNAFDLAIRHNSMRGISIMIDHVIKYQNNFVSANLFKNNFITMMEMGISVKGLLMSEVFYQTFELENFPTTHSDDTYCIRPYTGSSFQIEHFYDQLFGDVQD